MPAIIDAEIGTDPAPSDATLPSGIASDSIRCEDDPIHSPVIVTSQQRHANNDCLICAAFRLREAIAHIAAVHPLIRTELPDWHAERCLDDLADDLDAASSKLILALAALEDIA